MLKDPPSSPPVKLGLLRVLGPGRKSSTSRVQGGCNGSRRDILSRFHPLRARGGLLIDCCPGCRQDNRPLSKPAKGLNASIHFGKRCICTSEYEGAGNLRGLPRLFRELHFPFFFTALKWNPRESAIAKRVVEYGP